jgi:hypothetical protein
MLLLPHGTSAAVLALAVLLHTVKHAKIRQGHDGDFERLWACISGAGGGSGFVMEVKCMQTFHMVLHSNNAWFRSVLQHMFHYLDYILCLVALYKI